MHRLVCLVVAFTTVACAPPNNGANPPSPPDDLHTSAASPSPSSEEAHPPRADVTAARATGESGALTVHVTIRSDETGCEQYADWWELVTPEGELVARRILAHSHPDDNPFERSEPNVAWDTSDTIIVRAHMAPGGYVGDALEGSFDRGFTTVELPAGWLSELESAEPQPTDCLF